MDKNLLCQLSVVNDTRSDSLTVTLNYEDMVIIVNSLIAQGKHALADNIMSMID